MEPPLTGFIWYLVLGVYAAAFKQPNGFAKPTEQYNVVMPCSSTCLLLQQKTPPSFSKQCRFLFHKKHRLVLQKSITSFYKEQPPRVLHKSVFHLLLHKSTLLLHKGIPPSLFSHFANEHGGEEKFRFICAPPISSSLVAMAVVVVSIVNSSVRNRNKGVNMHETKL